MVQRDMESAAIIMNCLKVFLDKVGTAEKYKSLGEEPGTSMSFQATTYDFCDEDIPELSFPELQ